MSRRGRSGVINNTILPIGLHVSSSNSPMPSHKTVHIIVEKSPTRSETMHERNTEYSGFERGIPPTSRASASGPCGNSNQYETFGSNHHCDLACMLDERNTQTMSSGSKREKQTNSENPTPISPLLPDTAPSSANFLLEKEHSQRNQSTERSQRSEKKRQDFLMQWFDRCVDKELNNHKETSLEVLLQYDPPTINIDKRYLLNFTRETLENISGASARQMEVSFDSKKEPNPIS